jgi:hypothetical protein
VKYGSGKASRAYAISTFHRITTASSHHSSNRDLHPVKLALSVRATGLPHGSSAAYFVSPESLDAYGLPTSKIMFISALGANADQASATGNGYVHYSIRNSAAWLGTGTGATDAIANFVHNDAKNVLMLDMHVEAKKQDAAIHATDLYFE